MTGKPRNTMKSLLIKDFLQVDGQIVGNMINNGGSAWYVDSSRTASGGGASWGGAFITITEAVAAASAYDTIFVKGNKTGETSDYAESVSVSVAQVGLRIVGVGNSPEGVMWTVGTAEGTILSLAAKDSYVTGFRFRPNGATSGKAIDVAVTALGSTIEGNIFRSTLETALYGIYIDSTADLTIRNNVFTSVETAIFGAATTKTIYRAKILDNLFDDKVETAGVNITGRACIIKGNDFTSDTPLLIDTYKDSVGEMNIVTRNTLPCAAAYETNCSGSTSDNWLGNYCSDVGSSVVGADSGITFGYPQG